MIPAIPAARAIIPLEMDLHKDKVTIAVLPEGAISPILPERLPEQPSRATLE